MHDIAKARVNGSEVGVLWKPPYRVDITGRLQAGANTLTVEVTNQWTNRLTGDRSLPADQRVLDTGRSRGFFFGRSARLADAGLIGPVTIVQCKEDQL